MGSPPPATMKITLALLSLAAAASAYPMFLLEEEPVVYRAPRQMPIQDRMPGLGGRRSDDLQSAADTAYGGPPVSRPRYPPLRWDESRSRCTAAPARGRDTTCSPPGDITTPSPPTWPSTTNFVNISRTANKKTSRSE